MAVTRNPNLGPSQMRARRRRLFLIRSLIILFFLLVVVLALAIFSGHQKVTINTVTISGNSSISEDEILSIVNRDMAGRYGYLFAKKNYLIFPRFQIKKDLLTEIKTIKDIDISWNSWGKIAISLTERKPHSVWCGNDIKILNTECFFVDSDSYIYKKAPTFSGSIYVKNYGVLTEEYFLGKDIYTQIFDLLKILEENKIKVVFVYYDGFDYHFGLESGPEIIFNNKTSFKQSFQNLFAAIESGNLDLVKDVSILNYIDLRFDNKVVVGKKDI
jgi:hypothetical protein